MLSCILWENKNVRENSANFKNHQKTKKFGRTFSLTLKKINIQTE